MSGKISGTTSNQPAPAVASSVGQRAAATASPTTGSAGATGSANGNATESVQITETASHLVTAEQALNDVPVINQSRVSQVRESLASGTYRISPERISNQLLQFERLLPEDSAE